MHGSDPSCGGAGEEGGCENIVFEETTVQGAMAPQVTNRVGRFTTWVNIISVNSSFGWTFEF